MKKGVSLIVLVITIIVMVILAGAIVLTLNNSGIIAKAEDAVKQTNLATIREVTQMAWAEAYVDGARTEQELKAAVDNALTQNKITADMYKGYTIKVTTSGVEFVYVDPTLNHSGIIPEGGTYITGRMYEEESGDTWDESGAVTYKAGDLFPQNVTLGDKYIYNNYEYVYGYTYNCVYEEFGNGRTSGWGVHWLGGSAVIGNVLQTINNLPITGMDYAYSYLPAGLVCGEGFEIPSTVKTMHNILGEGGIYIPENFAIAEGVTDLSQMFNWSSLTSVPSTFKIPKSATNLSGMFASRYETTLELTASFIIPEGVENISYMFDPTEWEEAAAVVGTITIDANPTKYEGCFKGIDMSKITLAGKCSRELKQLIANTGENADQVTIID